MAITVVASPVKLTWANFRVVPGPLLDPNDGSSMQSLVSFDFALPSLPPRSVGAQLALGDPNVLTITPNARVVAGAAQTPALLAHEQLHYDVGFAIGRVVAHELMRLRAPNQAALGQAMQAVVQLHFIRRAQLIQRRYDLETDHSRNAHFQAIWTRNMAHCLANPRSDRIAGWWL